MSDEILASDNQQETQDNRNETQNQVHQSQQGQEQEEEIGSRMQRQLLPQASFLQQGMKDENNSEEKENNKEIALKNRIMDKRDSQSQVKGQSQIGNRKNNSQNSQKSKRELNTVQTKVADQKDSPNNKDISLQTPQNQTNDHEIEREPESWIIVDPEHFQEIKPHKSKNSHISSVQEEKSIINSEGKIQNYAEISQEVGQIRMTFEEFMEKQSESQQREMAQQIHKTSFFEEQPSKKDEKETIDMKDISFKNLKDSIKEIGRYKNSSQLRDQGIVKNIEESAEEVFKKILKSSSQVSSRQQLESSNNLAKQFPRIGSDEQLEEKTLALSGIEQAKPKENAKSGVLSKKQNTKKQMPQVNYWNQNYEKNKQNLVIFLEKNRKRIRGFIEEKGSKQQSDLEGEYYISFRQFREYLALVFEKENFKILESEESPVDVFKNKNIAAIMSTVLKEYVRSNVKRQDEDEQEQENQKIDEKTYLITYSEMEIFLDFWLRVDEQLIIVYQQDKDQVKTLLAGSIVQWENAKANTTQGSEQSVISATLQFLKEQYKMFEVKILHTNVKKNTIEKMDQSEIEAGILKIFKEYASVSSKSPTFDEIRESSKFMNLNNYFRFAKDYGISSILQGADIIGLFHKNCTGKNMSFQQFVTTLYKIVQSTTQTIAPSNSSQQANIAIVRLLKLKSSNSSNEDTQIKKEQLQQQPQQTEETSKFLVRRSLSPRSIKNPLNYNKPRSQPLDTDTDKINWQQIDKLSYQQVNELWGNKDQQPILKSKSPSSKALVNNRNSTNNQQSPEKRILKQKLVHTDPLAYKNNKEFFNPNDLINGSDHDLNEALQKQYRITGQIKAQGLPLIKLPLITHNQSERLPSIDQPRQSRQLINSSKNLPESTPTQQINQVRTIKQAIQIPKAKSTSPMRNDNKDYRNNKPSIFTNANKKPNIQIIKGNNGQSERSENLTENQNIPMFMQNEFLNYYESPPLQAEIAQIPNGINLNKPAGVSNFLYQPNPNPNQDFQMNYNQPAQILQPQPIPIQQFVQSRVFYGIQPPPPYGGQVNSKVPSTQSPSPQSSKISPSNSSGSPNNSSQPSKQLGKVNQQPQQFIPPQQSQFFPQQQMQAHSVKQPQGYAFQSQQKQQQQQLLTQQQPQQQNYLSVPLRKNQQISIPQEPIQPGFVRVVPAWQHQQLN